MGGRAEISKLATLYQLLTTNYQLLDKQHITLIPQGGGNGPPGASRYDQVEVVAGQQLIYHTLPLARRHQSQVSQESVDIRPALVARGDEGKLAVLFGKVPNQRCGQRYCQIGRASCRERV